MMQGQEKNLPSAPFPSYYPRQRRGAGGGVENPTERSGFMVTSFQQRFVPMAICLWLSAFSGDLRADDDKAGGGKSTDDKIFNILTTIINDGADLYNRGEASACFYLFKGALMTLQIQLEDAHPDLKKTIEDGMAKAEKQERLSTRAFTLRNVLGDIRAKVKPKNGEKKAQTKKDDKDKADLKKADEKKRGEEKKKEDKKKDDKKSDDKEKGESKGDSQPKEK
jgi:hypothetical protein